MNSALFQCLEPYLLCLGVLDWSLRNRDYKICRNIYAYAIFAIHVLSVISLSWFYLFDAKNSSESIESMFYVLSYSLTSLWYLNFIRNREQYPLLFDKLHSIIEKSKWKCVRNRFARSHKPK